MRKARERILDVSLTLIVGGLIAFYASMVARPLARGWRAPRVRARSARRGASHASTHARLDELGRYEVLTFTDPFGSGIERGKAIGVIDATPEEVFRVATDYNKYRDFMPRVTVSRSRRRRATTRSSSCTPICAGRPAPRR